VNAVANAFISEVSRISGTDDLILLDEAHEAQRVQSFFRQAVILIGTAAIAGLSLSVLYFILREIFSSRLVTVADGTLNGRLAVIGVIPLCSMKPAGTRGNKRLNPIYEERHEKESIAHS
jgi:capsular polysaccharide biosynthesis protein